ncbi:uncharacterized protein LMH87_007706 [Akanthomyces muscarius]|uniref:SET domain-containing protein n=1 Tax=Akanthomyces muscarius TaxID=2231603 RepID=A0A9W8URC3_AKAMU|nr:uncharacterized protein LMH87_007706 [Akanthomyces muscarius]KAJ4161681.1 hypothetical protein LMH87_007706 [Akanthomyces muscarius]
MSIHGLLAADFVLNPPTRNWVNVIPTVTEFNSIPFFWPEAAQKMLPGAAKRLLDKQRSTFGRDWEQFQSGYPKVASEDYMHAWFVVSTRAFYQETRQTLRYAWRDRLALLPVADLFNHAAVGCKVSYGADSHEMIADRKYSKGDEACTSYGEHSNDFCWPKLNAEEAALLKQMKTAAALRQVCGPATEEEALRDDDGWFEKTSATIDGVKLRELLTKCRGRIQGHRRDVLALGDSSERYQALLRQRWGCEDRKELK